jgi:hypothetical protein
VKIRAWLTQMFHAVSQIAQTDLLSTKIMLCEFLHFISLKISTVTLPKSCAKMFFFLFKQYKKVKLMFKEEDFFVRLLSYSKMTPFCCCCSQNAFSLTYLLLLLMLLLLMSFGQIDSKTLLLKNIFNPTK